MDKNKILIGDMGFSTRTRNVLREGINGINIKFAEEVHRSAAHK